MLISKYDSPLGPMSILASGAGVHALIFDGQKHAPNCEHAIPGDNRAMRQLRQELDGYFAGQVRQFHAPLAPQGTPFQQRVWAGLLAIPFGQTSPYGALAAMLGNAQASRAVGAAVGRNPISIAIPCHRVIGASGALTGYAGGLDRKRALLALEIGAAIAAA
jgi:methylated-DNA-[protein]-cysteine S-methyltransferase